MLQCITTTVRSECGHKFTTINHFLYKDDIKLYVKEERGIEFLI